MEILRNSNASQFNLLHLAYRVTPLLAADMSETNSASLVIGTGSRDAAPGARLRGAPAGAER